jgi:glycosyltransferase involved in cell wall biosynthesis
MPKMPNYTQKKRILIVARWPLGGIRTYITYIFGKMPLCYEVTIFAASTHEDHALAADCSKLNAVLKIVQVKSTGGFTFELFRHLLVTRYDVILSQGFISLVAAYTANLCFRIPHILTIHGIVESRYLAGALGFPKRSMLGLILGKVTVLYAVSNDILEHLYDQFPRLKIFGPKAIVIENGIDLEVLEQVPEKPLELRKIFEIEQATFLFGFLGRFMPQKGFDLIIEAVDILKQHNPAIGFAVLAVGENDYLREYRSVIKQKGLEHFFYFLPFQSQVHHLYPQFDTVVIPSIWEACPLLPMEALSMGTPIIASDCIGLREAVASTPARVFLAGDAKMLAAVMGDCVRDNFLEEFRLFIPTARERYDSRKSTERFVRLIESMPGRS